MATLEEQRELYAEKIRKIDARLARKKAREKEAERKLRDHTLIQEMGVALRHLGIEYNEIDAESWDAFWEKNAANVRELVRREPMGQKETRAAWNDLRVRHREEKKQKRIENAGVVVTTENDPREGSKGYQLWTCPGCDKRWSTPPNHAGSTCRDCGTRVVFE